MWIRRRRSLFRIVHARGAIPIELGPTRCRAGGKGGRGGGGASSAHMLQNQIDMEVQRNWNTNATVMKLCGWWYMVMYSKCDKAQHMVQ